MIQTKNTKDIDLLLSERSKQIPNSFIREILSIANQPDMISFAGGLPNPNCFPIEALSESASRVMKDHATSALQYTTTAGHDGLRTWLAQRYRHQLGIPLNPDNIMIVSGAQQSLDLIGKLFIDPGDNVLIENPGYLGAQQSLSAYQANFIPFNMLHDGPDMEQIRYLIDYNPIKLCYTVPNFQNPTGFTYSDTKRQQFASALDGKPTLLIEDSPYEAIYFDSPPPTPIMAYLPEQTIYCGSFSKMIAPGLRLGWIMADTKIIQQLTRLKQATDLHSSTLNQYILYDFLSHNDLETHLTSIRHKYRQQMQLMVSELKKRLPTAGIHFHIPQGGMFIWLQLPDHIDSNDLLNRCIQYKMAFVPGNTFFIGDGGSHALRLNFSNSSAIEIEKGIQVLSKAILEYI